MKDNYNQDIKVGDYISFYLTNSAMIGKISKCYSSGIEAIPSVEIKNKNGMFARYATAVIKMDQKLAKKLFLERKLRTIWNTLKNKGLTLFKTNS